MGIKLRPIWLSIFIVILTSLAHSTHQLNLKERPHTSSVGKRLSSQCFNKRLMGTISTSLTLMMPICYTPNQLGSFKCSGSACFRRITHIGTPRRNTLGYTQASLPMVLRLSAGCHWQSITGSFHSVIPRHCLPTTKQSRSL